MSNALRRVLSGAGIAALLFFAYITAIRLAFVLAYFAVLLVGLCWSWARLAGRGITVVRESRSGVYEVGQEFREKLEVINGSLVGAPWVAIEDQARIPGYEASRVFGLPARGSRRWTSRGRFTVRGRYSLGPLRVTTGDPFGFFSSTRVLAVTGAVIVHPRLLDVTRYLPGASSGSGEAGIHGRYTDSPPDALGIREYDASDGFNRVHWPSTARLGRPMSRSFERYEGSDTLVVLDLAIGVHHGSGAASSLEQAVSLAASVVMTALQQGQSVGLRCNDAAGTVFGSARGPAHLRVILDFLAIAQPSGGRGVETVLAGSAARVAQSVVVITPAVPALWVDNLAGARERGRRVTVLRLTGVEGEGSTRQAIAGMSWWEVGRAS
ncbi:MAG: DUF58 domain-containing protein [Candidatus Dormibacteria bacterium]